MRQQTRQSMRAEREAQQEKERRQNRRAYSYLRVSDTTQEHGHGPTRQLQRTQTLCERNGWILDEGLRLEDMGVSSFRGRNAKKGALSKFLAAVRAGKIPKGSVLVIENVDRLSRQEPEAGRELVKEILQADVDVATVVPEKVYSRKSLNDLGDSLTLLIELGRAHGESLRKSDLSGDNWDDTREAARTRKTALHPISYGWLRTTDNRPTTGEKHFRGNYELVPERVEVVRKMIAWLKDGNGERGIARRLSAEGVETWGRKGRAGKRWSSTYVKKVLTSRALFGEGRPKWLVDGVVVEQEPIADYYPAVITKDEFDALQGFFKSRTFKPGRGTGVNNLFTGILTDAIDKCPMYFVGPRSKKYGYLICSADAIANKAGSHYLTFPYQAIESSFLYFCEGLKAADLVPANTGNCTHESIKAAEAKLEAIDYQMSMLRADLANPDNADLRADIYTSMRTLKAEQQTATTELETLRAKRQTTEGDSLSQLHSVSGLLKRAKPEEEVELRTRLRARIADVVRSVEVTILKFGQSKFSPKNAVVKITFKSGVVLVYSVDQDGNVTENNGIEAAGWTEKEE